MLRKIISFLIVNTATVYLVHQLLTNFTITGGIWGYLLVGTVIGILNTFLRPILHLLSLPLLFITAGLFSIVINAGILYIAKELIAILNIEGITFAIEGFFTYIGAALILGIFNYVFHKIIK